MMDMDATPHRDDLRRRTLLNAFTGVSASVSRRSLAGPSNAHTPLTPIDEEQERSARRSIVAVRRRLDNISSPGRSPFTDAIPLMEESQIQDHLKICAKLHAENKISSKNAWKLHVIDVMRKIASMNNENVLQVAGTSLDIGAKVYGLRVDDVHAKSLQLASSMNKSNEKQATREDNEEEGDEGASLNEPLKRRNVRKRNKKMAADKRNTIDSEEKTLYAPIKHVESAVFATKENIDVCATDNLFTQKLPTNPATRQLMLMSDQKYWSLERDVTLKDDDKLLQIDVPRPTHYELCIPFKDFEIGAWDPEEEEKLFSEQPSLEEPVLDAQGIPIAELDGSIHDIFEDQNDGPEDCASDTEERQQQEFQVQLHGEIANIVDAIPEENRFATDYGYNTLVKSSTGKYIDKLWAGPSHWKVKFIRRSTARFSGSTVQQVVKQSKKTKAPQKVDFSNFDGFSEPIVKYVVKRAPPTVPFEKITLPAPEADFSYDDFTRITSHLLTKPGVPFPKLPINNVPEQRDPGYGMTGYNYENPNDSLYCSQHNIDEANDNEPMQNSLEEDVAAAAQQQFLDDNLVHAPEMVSATHILYAMQAKKMDMKKLKSAIWRCIVFGNCESATQTTIKPIRGSEVYRKLPQLLPTDMRKELTVHLAVVALLHLCNENNLKLQKQERSKDFTILKAVR